MVADHTRSSARNDRAGRLLGGKSEEETIQYRRFKLPFAAYHHCYKQEQGIHAGI